MASVNKVILVGNLGRDPEVRYTPNGSAVCNVTIATSRVRKNKESGDKSEDTEWHRVVFFDKLAEIAGEYLKKGRSVYVEGRLQTRKWTDKDELRKAACTPSSSSAPTWSCISAISGLMTSVTPSPARWRAMAGTW